MASEDPAVDSGLKAVCLLKRHSLLACNTTPAVSLEGSIGLCNDYRHASPPARSESRGVVDVQVDFTGLAIYARIAPHKTGHAGVPHSMDQTLFEEGAEHPCHRDAFAQQLSSKSMTSCGRVRLSLTGHSRCLAPYCDLVHVKPCRRKLEAARELGVATVQRCEWQHESAISRMGAAIAT